MRRLALAAILVVLAGCAAVRVPSPAARAEADAWQATCGEAAPTQTALGRAIYCESGFRRIADRHGVRLSPADEYIFEYKRELAPQVDAGLITREKANELITVRWQALQAEAATAAQARESRRGFTCTSRTFMGTTTTDCD